MKSLSILSLLSLVLFFVSCNTKKPAQVPKVLYKTDNLSVIQLSDHVYQHISYLNTDSFGRVPCNGMIVKEDGEAVIFDTPSDDKSSAELISWIKNNLHVNINAVVATHFHSDCLGGLKEFERNKISSYASTRTIELAKKNNENVPQHSFDNDLTLKVGRTNVFVKYFGEGHTKDNVIAYFPDEKVMFGGCLIKEIGATKGYLGDANVKAWSGTVKKIKKQYPDVRIVIPGHGDVGGIKLLDYTINLFKDE
ncbi:subclass B1 metallo-beta-lactamase [Chryseobacterium lactis]|uniref:beta-lactamase n=1 Tax=Chryseobacterium lactis TaxID=1241981 RepID=A0A3G6RQA1_CHRLC|nr:CIM family subclass B1 metallo-beta-lactamase [Chryseobacterium lactis]AZA80417.1 subclass B1 metallo-beta-lactamase [Chryseobacterium lactis]AZB05419.1 subclass B1 metallo-beta-lactamase [Chryseobacterium lactis]PNW11568.1 subclass B1 metallo-beta-lactamase [Chryseobacterium lactis]